VKGDRAISAMNRALSCAGSLTVALHSWPSSAKPATALQPALATGGKSGLLEPLLNA
jgi:hypothetical protein